MDATVTVDLVERFRQALNVHKGGHFQYRGASLGAACLGPRTAQTSQLDTLGGLRMLVKHTKCVIKNWSLSKIENQ